MVGLGRWPKVTGGALRSPRVGVAGRSGVFTCVTRGASQTRPLGLDDGGGVVNGIGAGGFWGAAYRVGRDVVCGIGSLQTCNTQSTQRLPDSTGTQSSQMIITKQFADVHYNEQEI